MTDRRARCAAGCCGRVEGYIAKGTEDGYGLSSRIHIGTHNVANIGIFSDGQHYFTGFPSEHGDKPSPRLRFRGHAGLARDRLGGQR